MALLERVSTLLRANLNDMLDKAEDPAKMMKQLVLDMENQLLQVKTQVAIAIADQHLLEAKKKEHEAAMASWRKKAELALNRNDEALARSALDRSLQSEQLLTGYAQQLDDQREETVTLREQYRQLEAKLAETSAQAELLLQQHRRAVRTSPVKVLDAQRSMNKVRGALVQADAQKLAARALDLEDGTALEDRFRTMEREDRIEALLEELKGSHHLLHG